MRHCDGCNTDRKEDDFFHFEICYKCIYKAKMIKANKERLLRTCRICHKVIPSNRTVYCNSTCAEVGIRQQKREYWTNKVKG